jgi:hypothetical protein
MPDHDAIGRERLDRRDSARVKQTLKAIQRALAFEHEPHDGAFGSWIAAPHGFGP